MNTKLIQTLVTAGLLTLGAVAIAAQRGTAGTAASTSASAGSGASTSLARNDSNFLTKAAIGGMAEVELGKLAAQKASSDQVKKFAQHMVDDHTKANDELMKIASQKGATAPTDLDAEHKAAMTKLSALSGEKFDRAYIQNQKKDHIKMIDLFKNEARNGKDADLKNFAAKTLPTVQEHEAMAKNTK